MSHRLDRGAHGRRRHHAHARLADRLPRLDPAPVLVAVRQQAASRHPAEQLAVVGDDEHAVHAVLVHDLRDGAQRGRLGHAQHARAHDVRHGLE